MPENIFEHTTSIAGLTCKPLSIFSETISTQEMSMVRGGNEGEDTMFELMVSNSDSQNDDMTGDKVCQSNPDCYDERDVGGNTQSGTLFGNGPPILYGNYGNYGGSGGGGGGSSESDTISLPDTPSPIDPGPDNENDDEDHFGDFWDFDFSDDGTEDECTVPYDCGYDEYDEEEEDYSEDETEEDTEVYDP